MAMPKWVSKMAEAPKGLAKDIDEGMDKLKGNILETWQTSLNNMAKLTLKTGEDAAAGASGDGGSGGLGGRGSEAMLVEEMERIREESRQTCILIFKEHLEDFLRAAPKWPAPTYEAWIKDLHPENAKSKRGRGPDLGGSGDSAMVAGGGGGPGSLDHRFYLADSDHLIMWNKHPGVNEANRVVPRLPSDDIVSSSSGGGASG